MPTTRHHVTVYLRYTETGTPWKWQGDCTCGWHCLSWQWIAEDRPGGALPMAIEHIDENRPRPQLRAV